MKIEKTKNYDGFEIDTKRFYLPFVATVACKNCGEFLTSSLEEQYLYYPCINEPIERSVYCESCDEETLYSVKVDVNVSLIEEKND